MSVNFQTGTRSRLTHEQFGVLEALSAAGGPYLKDVVGAYRGRADVAECLRTLNGLGLVGRRAVGGRTEWHLSEAGVAQIEAGLGR